MAKDENTVHDGVIIWGRAPFSEILGRVPSPQDWYHLQRATELAGCATGLSTQRVRQEIKLARYDTAINNLLHLIREAKKYGQIPDQIAQSRDNAATTWRKWVAQTGVHVPYSSEAFKAAP